jgi:hypothetical protein
MRNQKPLSIAAALACASLLIGCSSSGNGGDAASNAKPVAKNGHAKTFDALPAGHTFTKLSYGMGETEVRDTIGEPTDRGGYVTGQAWNPFYYGTDTNRTTWYYKGLGRLTFNSRGRLIEAHANADERGYR